MTNETTTRPAVETGSWTLDKAHTKVGFVAKHLMVTKVRGHFGEFDASIEVGADLTDSTVTVTLDAASITTGAADRDDHLRSPDFLDVADHPEMTFASTSIETNGERWSVTGDLTIRDVSHPITLDVAYEGTATDPWGKEHVAFSAQATVTREDWGLTWNAPLEGGGWLVSKDVVLVIEGQLIRP
jgi:polyisoprenoid-binding protein YceI